MAAAYWYSSRGDKIGDLSSGWSKGCCGCLIEVSFYTFVAYNFLFQNFGYWSLK